MQKEGLVEKRLLMRRESRPAGCGVAASASLRLSARNAGAIPAAAQGDVALARQERFIGFGRAAPV